ncbi:hypothetical protein SDC9_167321 [bioreactor metagenome]|uniref:Uncharacterized protein n=1 Tax=bioreactor metagenome TaxID=1076179 RepID=A0A645G1B2_9ZZZZ
MSGIVKTPVVATLADALPLMQPTRALETTAALAGPPIRFPVSAKAMSMKSSEPRVASRKAPKITNIMMIVEAVPSGVLKTPAELT